MIGRMVWSRTSTNYSRESGHHMRGSLLPHSLCDVHLLVLYILPYFLTCFFGKPA